MAEARNGMCIDNKMRHLKFNPIDKTYHEQVENVLVYEQEGYQIIQDVMYSDTDGFTGS